ncbi:P-loop containing nucleoside triphosphate hydrolase protein [Pisolithus sp. B1]|nr:P-loop containing nucleoside triphosphate hydrolase protein [Pisolithus sp. B1]
MVDTRVSLFTGKLSFAEDISSIKPSRYKLKGFQGKRDRRKQEETSFVEIDSKLWEQPATSVGFTQLFRYATPFELFLNAVGVVSAMAAVFGRLIQDFVTFTTALETYQSADSYGNAIAISSARQDFDSAARELRRAAAQNASYLAYVGVGMAVCTWIYMYLWIYTGEVNAKRIREKYLQAILRQDVGYFDHVGAGEVATRIQTDTLQQGISEKVPLVVNFLSAFFVGFILAYTQSWRLALAMSPILPFIVITSAIMNKLVAKYTQAALQYVAESGTIAEEAISTVRTVQALGSQKVLGSLFNEKIYSIRTLNTKSSIWHGCGLGVLFFFLYSAYALAFSFGTTLINGGYATAGQVVNVFMAILSGSFSTVKMAPDARGKPLINARGAAAKLFAAIERVPDIDSARSDGLKLEKVIGKITLEDVQFSYPARTDVPVLKGIDITFEAGKRVALVGASGSGKSTIISLVERFYDPLSGTVRLDGVDLRDLNIKWLRTQIGLVSQEPVLFATTIRANVAYGLIGTPYEHASEDEKFKLIKEACIKSNADDFIGKLAQGYDTMVGEHGFLLSGGQKQRVAIARAIVSDPRILLLDEATSALDTRSEGLVQDSLDKASAGRTTISIAHRLSTIKGADRIFVIGEGVVLEQGTHEDLIARSGPYAHFVQAQKLREAEEVQIDTDIAVVSNAADKDKVVEDEVPLNCHETHNSVTSGLACPKNEEKGKGEVDEKSYGLFHLFRRIGSLNPYGYRLYVIGTVAAMASGMVYPVFAIIYGKALSGFSQPDASVRSQDGNMNAPWFFVVAIVSSVVIAIQNYVFTLAASNLTTKLRTLSFRAILRQDIQFFDRAENSTGALTSRVNDHPQKVEGLAGVTLGAIIQAFTSLVGSSIIGLAYAWKPALVGIACVPLVFSAGFIRLRVVVLKDQQNKAAHDDSAKLACEAASAIRTVASLTREDDCLKLYSSSLEESLRNSNKSAIWSNLVYAFSQSCTFWTIALVFWYGSGLIASLEVSGTNFFTTLMVVTFGVMQAGSVFAWVPDISSACGAGTAIIKLLESIPESDDAGSGRKTFEGRNVEGRIRLENVHFCYPTRPTVPVLRGLNLTVAPGTYVALVGASGCGKSTVIQLIERFYYPSVGQILLDTQPIKECNLQEYRKQIALVSQEPTLYSGTIRLNILLGATRPMSEVTQEEIETVCRDANILDFIQSLPNGFDTEVGGKGSQLSGGQKQRIAIARALLRGPKVLLLDEATSALDSTSEKVVQEALDRAAKGRTTIAIAHRLSTIQNADCMYMSFLAFLSCCTENFDLFLRSYFIKDGRVSEAGTHDQLLALMGDYYEHVQLQVLKE